MDSKELKWNENTPDEATLQTQAARDAFYESLGEVHEMTIRPIEHPMLTGDMPVWPGKKPTWKVINRPHSVIIVSDGMSDPYWDDGTPLGFGVEVCAEMPGNMEEIEMAITSCLFRLVKAVCDTIAANLNLLNSLDYYPTISFEPCVPCMPEAFHTTDKGHAGMIVNYPSPSIPAKFSTPYGEVRMLTVVPLYAQETFALREAGNEAGALRDHFVATLQQQAQGHLCFTQREPMVENQQRDE